MNISLEISLPNSDHVVTCEVSGKFYSSMATLEEPAEEEFYDIEVENICWGETGREVKQKGIIAVVNEMGDEAFCNYDWSLQCDNDDPRGGDGPDD